MHALSIEEIVCDEELDAVWGSANFGSCTKREVVYDTLLKCLGGFVTGYTARHIVKDLKLVHNKRWDLTKKGEIYLYLCITKSPPPNTTIK